MAGALHAGCDPVGRPGRCPSAGGPRRSPDPVHGWGGSSSGAYCYWYRVGDDPNKWPVVSADVRDDVYLFHRGGMAAFIIAYVTGQYEAVAEIVAEADLSFDRWDAVGHGG